MKPLDSYPLFSFNIIPHPPLEGILFVDHAKHNRTGHLGHALIEYEDEKILAFYPNCSPDNDGHSAVGWMEYRRSEDGGRSWSDSMILEYSKRIFDEEKGYAAMCEKAVLSEDGTIILFHLISHLKKVSEGHFHGQGLPRYSNPQAMWEPFCIPTYIRSFDKGYTWTPGKNLGDTSGRVYDALSLGSTIFALHFSNDASKSWSGTMKEHLYILYTSTDNGETFSKRSELPFNTKDRGYGAMAVLPSGSLIVYIYNKSDEEYLDYTISHDNGYTWSEVKKTFFAKKIRNPQVVSVDGGYFLHGRSGQYGEGSGHLVLYTSIDGVNWDAGFYLQLQKSGNGAYSNNLVVGRMNEVRKTRVLIQASHAYELHKTNIYHWWLENICTQDP